MSESVVEKLQRIRAERAARLATPAPSPEAAAAFGDPARCSSCDAPIRWITTPAGRKMPLDPEPVEVITVSNWEVAAQGAFSPRETREPVLYRPLDPPVMGQTVHQFGGYRVGPEVEGPRTLGWRPHWASCPNAAQHRRSR